MNTDINTKSFILLLLIVALFVTCKATTDTIDPVINPVESQKTHFDDQDVPINFTIHPNQYWLKNNDTEINIAHESARKISLGSESVIIAIVDTGVDLTHPELKDALWINEIEANGEAGVDDDGNGYVDDIHGYDFISDHGNPLDSHGHGTGIAGVIAAQGIKLSGIAPKVRLMILRQNGRTFAQALDYAAANGADIVTRSGGRYGVSLLEKDEIYQAVARLERAGVLLVTGAGNKQIDLAGPEGKLKNQRTVCGYTLLMPHVMCVGRVKRNGVYASGRSADIVSLAGPGEAIYSTAPRRAILKVSKATDSGYASFNGNSFFTPMVAATAALMLSVNPNLTPKEIRDILENTTSQATHSAGLTKTDGILNAGDAVTMAAKLSQ